MSEVERLTNCTTGGPVFVDVDDGKIVRIPPSTWTTTTRATESSRPGDAGSARRTTLSPHAQASRSMVYSPKRILTPLKRVD